MNINFVTTANDGLASYRYHNQIPARELEKLGHKTAITNVPALNAEVYVFSKHFNYGDYWYLYGIMSQGKKGVFHCCDNHFETEHEAHYRRMIDMADIVISSTPEMAAIIKQETKREALVVPDSYEFEEKTPYFNFQKKLNVLWFGHPSNLDSLMDILPDLEEHDLRLCTYPKIPKKLEGIPLMPYSLENLKKAFEWCDVVILPSRLDIRKLVKSHNRLIESVRSGKFVIASGIPAYKEYADWMYIGDIKEGIAWITGQAKEEIENRIKQAQTYIKKMYNPEIIGSLWEGALCR